MAFPSELRMRLHAMIAFWRVTKRGGYSPNSGFPETQAFEQEFAEFLDLPHYRVRGVNSSTDAVIYALKLAGITQGDEVIVPTFGFITPAAATCWVGAQPVFADVNANTLCLDVSTVKQLVTKRTRAIIASHVYGHTGKLESLRLFADSQDLVLIEDSAQLIGATESGRNAGTIGHFGCLSFSAVKPFTSYGNAGALITPDKHTGTRARWISNYGSSRLFKEYPIVGTNASLQEIQAAILREFLPFLPELLDHLKQLDKRYRERFSESKVLYKNFAIFPDIPQPYNIFPVRAQQREKVCAHLAKTVPDLFTRFSRFILPPHLQTAYRSFVPHGMTYPTGTAISQEMIALPLTRTTTQAQVDRICDSLEEFVAKYYANNEFI